MNALEPSEVIDAKPDSLEWRFLYCARKEGVVAMRTFLQNGHIREEDTKYIRDLRGRSALHFAATTGNVEMIPFFTHLVNAFDRDGYTPLHIAVWFGYTDFVEALIKENADANITSRDETEMTPIDMARRFEWHRTEQLIANMTTLNRPHDKAPAPIL